ESPKGFSDVSTRASINCCARITDVTTAMPSAASVQPCASHCRFASARGSIGRGRERGTVLRYWVGVNIPERRSVYTLRPSQRENDGRTPSDWLHTDPSG